MAATSHVKLVFLKSKVKLGIALERVGGFLCLFWKQTKSTLILEKIVCVHLGIKFSLEMQFQEYI